MLDIFVSYNSFFMYILQFVSYLIREDKMKTCFLLDNLNGAQTQLNYLQTHIIITNKTVCLKERKLDKSTNFN